MEVWFFLVTPFSPYFSAITISILGLSKYFGTFENVDEQTSYALQFSILKNFDPM